MIQKISTFLIALTLGVLIFPDKANAQTESSLGISPSRIVQNFLRPSLVTRQEIVISRSDVTSEQAIEIQLQESEISSWIEIIPGSSVVMAEGESRTTVTLKITVPDDAEYKKYESSVKIILKGSNPVANVNIEPGVEIGLDFIVTDKQVKDFKVLSAQIKDTLVKTNLMLLLNIENTGNVPTGPTRAELKIFDTRKQPVTTLEKTITKIIEPLSTEKISVEFESKNLAKANYLATAYIYNEAGEVVYEQDLSFKVVDIIVDDDPRSATSEFNVLDYWYVALIIFVLIIVGKVIHKMIKRRKIQ